MKYVSVGNNLSYSYHKRQRFLFSAYLKLGVRFCVNSKYKIGDSRCLTLVKMGVFLNVTSCILVTTYHTSERQM